MVPDIQSHLGEFQGQAANRFIWLDEDNVVHVVCRFHFTLHFLIHSFILIEINPFTAVHELTFQVDEGLPEFEITTWKLFIVPTLEHVSGQAG